ncbi:MAG: hypothetical protein KAW89_06995 [Armatimonadetes bacterium]|nr:hypothetical protein [Armatimonadota bacterium]
MFGDLPLCPYCIADAGLSRVIDAFHEQDTALFREKVRLAELFAILYHEQTGVKKKFTRLVSNISDYQKVPGGTELDVVTREVTNLMNLYVTGGHDVAIVREEVAEFALETLPGHLREQGYTKADADIVRGVLDTYAAEAKQACREYAKYISEFVHTPSPLVSDILRNLPPLK